MNACPWKIFLVSATLLTWAAGDALAQAKITSVERKVEGFHSVALVGAGKVTIKQTGKEKLTIKGGDKAVQMAQVEVKNKVLTLTGIVGLGDTEFIVEVKTLEGLHLTGLGSMEAEKLDCKTLTVTVEGSGDLKVSGKAATLNVTATGTGNFVGDSLKADQVKVSHKGLGKAVVYANKDLDVTLSGIGSIEYLGDPKVKQSIVGLGTVQKRK